MDKENKKQRYIMHMDMDAFFAAIEQRDNPEYLGKPVIIGSDPKEGKGRGVVATCSYEARKFGIHSAMPISIAYSKCPQGVFLPVDMEKYCSASHQIDSVLNEFTPDIEWVSIDEAFLDITGSYHLFGTPYRTGLLLKSRIKKATGLTASVGIAPNKFVAKIASDIKKPDGLLEISQEDMLKFLWPLDVSKIWGVGKKSVKHLNEIGIYTIGDLAGKKMDKIVDVFGKNGEHFWLLANGIDDREVEVEGEVKSISNEFTFEQDTGDNLKIESVLLSLCEKVSGRMRQEGFRAKTITLKIRMQEFKTYTKAVSINKPTNFADVLFAEIKKIYRDFKKENRKVRLVGVKASNFNADGMQGDLFEQKEDEKKGKIHKAIEEIKSKFGKDAIYRSGGKIQS